MMRPIHTDYPDRDSTIPALSEALPAEMHRVRNLPVTRRNSHTRFAIKYAERAIENGDVTKMVNALNALKAHK